MSHDTLVIMQLLLGRVNTHMMSTLRELGVGEAKMRCYQMKGVGRLASALDVQSIFFY